jgi:hypothetical protein
MRMLAVFDGFRSLPAHDLIEVAALAACGFLLIQQGQIALVEFLEPLVPTDVFEFVLPGIARKIEAQNSDVILAAGPADASGLSLAPRSSAQLLICS